MINNPLATGPHFDREGFDAFIDRHGTPVLWRRSRTCPCQKPSTGSPTDGCPFCNGLGTLWDAGSEIKVVAPGRKRNDDYDLPGSFLVGSVMVDFPSCVTPGHLDRLDLKAGVMVVNNEVKFRGASNNRGNSTERVRLGGLFLEVQFCEAIIADALVEYSSPDDFSIDADGNITWVAGHGPDPDADPKVQYTLRYTAIPSFVCWSPTSRDENGVKMPYRCRAQRLDFFQQPGVGEGPV
jgi:hypothetical protein